MKDYQLSKSLAWQKVEKYDLVYVLDLKGVSGIRCIDSSIYNSRWLQVLILYWLLGSQKLQ